MNEKECRNCLEKIEWKEDREKPNRCPNCGIYNWEEQEETEE